MTPEKDTFINIEDELKSSYLDYAMSVIVGRALPDARDGLKPVHRRILYTMHDSGLHHNRSFVKCARIVGDVMGKLHPHGDTAIYDTLARLAQDFSMRYTLVDGQGNFGSVDGDPPAAMRYTEARLERISGEILEDIEKETVDWKPSYDEKQLEPTVLPTKVPLLLLNGSEGIAVGMATKIPPHNLGELLDGLMALADNPDISVSELMQHIPGPDFPTGGYICGRSGIYNAYTTGRGRLVVRAKMDVEARDKGDKESIIISEIPYQVNKTRLLEEIASAVKEKRIEGVTDLRDESDRDGMRIVVEIRRDIIADVIINLLYKLTNCQTTFGVINLALVGGQPREMSLKSILEYFLDFRRQVVTRRCEYEKKQAEARAHILEGLLTALDHIDAIITIIRSSQTQVEAQARMIEAYELSEKQTRAILDMRLARLTGLEREKIEGEYKDLREIITRLTQILADKVLLEEVIVGEFRAIRERYADERRTQIIDDEGEYSMEDLIADEDMVVTVSHLGYIKRVPLTDYRAQHRGGKGVIGMDTKEEDFVEQLYVASTHNYFLIFTNLGKVYWLKVYQIPKVGRTGRGKAIINLLKLDGSGERVVTILPVREFSEDRNIVTFTRKGYIKKTDLMAYSKVRSNGLIALKIDEGDDLIGAGITDGDQNILIATRNGMAIRFNEQNVRPMGRASRGVRGIRLKGDDYVVAGLVLSPDMSLLTVSENGFGKRTSPDEYRITRRGGMGVITIKTTERNGKVVAFKQVHDGEQLMMITEMGKIIRMSLDTMRIIGRNTAGVRMVNLIEGDRVGSVCPLPKAEENGEDDSAVENGDTGEQSSDEQSGDEQSSDEAKEDLENGPDESGPAGDPEVN